MREKLPKLHKKGKTLNETIGTLWALERIVYDAIKRYKGIENTSENYLNERPKMANRIQKRIGHNPILFMHMVAAQFGATKDKFKAFSTRSQSVAHTRVQLGRNLSTGTRRTNLNNVGLGDKNWIRRRDFLDVELFMNRTIKNIL